MDKVSNEYLAQLIKEVLSEEKADRCLRIARTKYDKPSAYRSGAIVCLLYTSPSPRDKRQSRMPSSA